MNVRHILMVIIPLVILMNAPTGQNFKIRLKSKHKNKHSLLSLGSRTDEDEAYNEDLKNILSSPQFEKYGNTFVLRGKSKIRELDWLMRPSTQEKSISLLMNTDKDTDEYRHKQEKSISLLMNTDKDTDEYRHKQGITEQKSFKNSRSEVRMPSFVKNYKKYKESYFMRKYANKELESKEGMEQMGKLNNNARFSEKYRFKSRLNRMLIGPIRQKNDKNKISKSRTDFKVNRKVAKQEKKVVMEKIGRAISIVLVAFVVVSFISLLASALVHIFSKICRETSSKREKYEGPQSPKSVFFADIDSSLCEEGEIQKSESASLQEERKEIVLSLEEIPGDNDIEETTPLLSPKSTSPKNKKDKYHSSSSSGAETVQTMVKIKTPVSGRYSSASYASDSSEKKEEIDLDTDVKLSKQVNRINSHEDEIYDFLKSSGVQSGKVSHPLPKTNEDTNAFQDITQGVEFSLNNQSHDLYTVPTIEYTNLASALQMKKECLKNLNQITYCGDSYNRSSVDRGLNFKGDFKTNYMLNGLTGKEFDKSRVDLCTIFTKRAKN
ncbi:uncharacterized protein LOC111633540 [Centruroides sculpturatus]|uniref:uncharacterized protein LOC111633540 n=1 Tax=Centruroides sculpturatus TaxID=218467 RepID=UPI000C6DFB82|nr:uncharacterized protein LOC111633540 [Centruroides sculpturatus]